MDLYQVKYLKYKSKYELLKKQYGGDPRKRICSDLKGLMKLPLVSYTYGTTEVPKERDIIFQNDKYTWKVYLNGPVGTPYEGYKWIVKITFPNDYPFKEADIKFENKIFHPNISFETGTLYLYPEWSAGFNMEKLFNKIIEKLINPKIDEPLNSVALTLYNRRTGYSEKVIEYAVKFAVPP
jgi:ubiquitin-protein ligase